MKRNILYMISIIFISVGIFILCFNYFQEKKQKAFSDMNLLLFESEMASQLQTDEPEDKVDEQIETNDEIGESEEEEHIDSTGNTVVATYNYIGILEIPKINLKKGFLALGAPYNDINHNVTVINSSNYPDVENGNLILAAHSGNAYISYFKYLYKLGIGDVAYVYYNSVKYTYKIEDIYNVPKTGTVAIRRKSDQTVLTLITCTYNSDTEQTVYIANLINKESY